MSGYIVAVDIGQANDFTAIAVSLLDGRNQRTGGNSDMNDYSGRHYFGKLEKIAEKIRIKDPSLTKEQAIAKAAEQNPRLKAAYSDEVRRDITGSR